MFTWLVDWVCEGDRVVVWLLGVGGVVGLEGGPWEARDGQRVGLVF